MANGALWLALAAGLIVGICTSAAVGAVRTENGLVEGVEEAGLAVFKGVPFAVPPVGDLRWRPPQPPADWRGVLKADTFKPRCPQPDAGFVNAPRGPKSEDCLYLNIWTPALKPDAKLPVMVWIYGGGFVVGSPSSPPVQWGDGLAKKGVVVVNITHRLGNLGFLAHPELSAESPHHVSGNYAILDVIAALQWVHQNIAAFGGDPGSVTVFGQSSGSTVVSLLMISPLAKGLFHRAIGQSGAYLPGPQSIGLEPPTLARAEQAGLKIAADLGVVSIDALRAMPADTVNAATNALFAPVIDGYVIPGGMFEVFGNKKHNDVALLVGSNDGEGDNLLRSPLSAAEFVKATRARFGKFADEILQIYPAGSDEEAARSQRRFLRDGSEGGWPAWTWARFESTNGNSKVFLYYFAQRPPYPPGTPMAGWGAAHGSEMIYTFGNYARMDWQWTDHDREVSEAMVNYWTNFAKAGDPNGQGVPEWPAFTATNAKVMRIGETITPVDLPNRPGLELVDRILARTLRGQAEN